MGATGKRKQLLLEQLGKLRFQHLQLTDPQLAGIPMFRNKCLTPFLESGKQLDLVCQLQESSRSQVDSLDSSTESDTNSTPQASGNLQPLTADPSLVKIVSELLPSYPKRWVPIAREAQRLKERLSSTPFYANQAATEGDIYWVRSSISYRGED